MPKVKKYSWLTDPPQGLVASVEARVNEIASAEDKRRFAQLRERCATRTNVTRDDAASAPTQGANDR